VKDLEQHLAGNSASTHPGQALGQLRSTLLAIGVSENMITYRLDEVLWTWSGHDDKSRQKHTHRDSVYVSIIRKSIVLRQHDMASSSRDSNRNMVVNVGSFIFKGVEQSINVWYNLVNEWNCRLRDLLCHMQKQLSSISAMPT
jgi:hypothetical protein